MYSEGRRINYWLVTCLVGLGIILGILGGSVAGGLAGYYAARVPAASAASLPAARPVDTLITEKVSQPGAQATNPQPSTALRLDYSSAVVDAVNKVNPAVVTILNSMQASRSFFGQSFSPTASGSGVIIDPQGFIITNNHVIENARQLEVIFSDGTKVPAKLVGTDAPYSDLAVLKVDTKVPAYATFGDSNALKLGEMVVAIGSPLGEFQGTVTAGIISGLNRKLDVDPSYALDGLIQTDAAINSGNSGGALINVQGQLIGINTAVVRGTQGSAIAEGLGFAIPSNLASTVAQQFITNGKVVHPYIGVGYNVISPQIASYYNFPVKNGIYVGQVEPGSPAEKAGLKVGDIIAAIGDQQIDNDHPWLNVLLKQPIGKQVNLTVWRGTTQMQIPVTLGSTQTR